MTFVLSRHPRFPRSSRAAGLLAAASACLAMPAVAVPAQAQATRHTTTGPVPAQAQATRHTTTGPVRPRVARHATAIAPAQTVALLFASHRAFAEPRAGAPAVGEVAVRRPITGERTVLPVLAEVSAHGERWLRVRLPGRPNSHTGWILARRTRQSTIFWHLLIDLRARRVTAYLDGRSVRTFRAVVGKPSTPTPTGQFFVEETMRMTPGDPGGPFALALSARSNVFRHFDGGPGQVAVHGRGGLGGTLGQAQSHGCVRLATPAIAWLALRFGPGTPVTIRAR